MTPTPGMAPLALLAVFSLPLDGAGIGLGEPDLLGLGQRSDEGQRGEQSRGTEQVRESRQGLRMMIGFFVDPMTTTQRDILNLPASGFQTSNPANAFVDPVKNRVLGLSAPSGGRDGGSGCRADCRPQR